MNAYNQLTPREKYIYQCLSDVNHDSIWGVAINRFKMEPTPDHLRQLIREMSEAAKDNPEAMAKVVGDELVGIFVQRPIVNTTNTKTGKLILHDKWLGSIGG